MANRWHRSAIGTRTPAPDLLEFQRDHGPRRPRAPRPGTRLEAAEGADADSANRALDLTRVEGPVALRGEPIGPRRSTPTRYAAGTAKLPSQDLEVT
jgi:hypothetical protein